MATLKKTLAPLQLYLPNILWILAVIYCSFAFIPIPGGVKIGLDPSWQYAISQAAAEKLIFGRDIIFTYGSFGYLIHGSVVEHNFWAITIFRLFIHFGLFAVILVRILALKSNILRLSLALSVLFSYWRVLSFSADYQILFIFLIILSFKSIWHPKSIRWWSLGLGAISGFCILTKLNLGICTFGSLTLILLVYLYTAIRTKSNITIRCISIVEAILVATSVAFVLLHPNYIYSNLTKIFICILASLTISFIFNLIYNLLISGKLQEKNKVKLNLPISSISFYLCYSLGLFILIHYSVPSLTAYLKSSWEISSGYSSAMSIVGPISDLILGVSQVILILIILFFVAREGSFGFSLGVALVLAISFKHGFIRQGGHSLFLFITTPIIVTLCIAKVTKKNSKIFSFFIHFYTLLVLLFVYQPYQPINTASLRNLAPVKIIDNVSTIFNLSQLEKQIHTSSKTNLSGAKLPEKIVKIIKDKPIDIVPWEISLVAANNLNWKPRPIFQSYSAYTSFLDQTNSKSLLKNPRDYIIYQFTSIDRRHPFFDEPETFFHIYCNYKLSSEIPDFVNTEKIYNLMLLDQRQSNICSPSVVGKQFSSSWNKNQSLEAKDGLMVRAAVKIEYSTFGKIYKTLFRSPPVKMQVTYVNNQVKSYRIIPENSNNGVIISHLPKDNYEALSFFKGNLPVRIKSFRFSNKNPILYKPNIKIKLTSYNLLDKSIKQDSWIDISKLTDIRFLDTKMDTDGLIDTQNKNAEKAKRLKRGKKISVSGWAINKNKKGEIIWILLTSGSNNKPLLLGKTGGRRSDIAKVFKNSKYTNSGWSIDFSSQDMPKGVHNIRAWIYEPTGKLAIPISGNYRVDIH
ncbi:MAG: hypothetical protein QNJ36_02115 [Calothrix sp. MO_167.B42]|nr:hypothetical protein [Calothrix sp. MO_167.B42]